MRMAAGKPHSTRDLRHDLFRIMRLRETTRQDHENVTGAVVRKDERCVVGDVRDVAGLVRDAGAGRKACRDPMIEFLR